MFDSITACPAYGRDYNSKAACLADWLDGKDFRCAVSGRYLSIRDAQSMNLEVWLRYKKLTQVIKAPVPATK